MLIIWNVALVVDVVGSARAGGFSATAAMLDNSDNLDSDNSDNSDNLTMTNQDLFRS